MAKWPALALLFAAAALYAQDDATKDLLDAAAAGDTPRVQAVLQAGAKVDSAGKNGRTALMLAAQRGHADTVKALLAAGADPTHRDTAGFTPYTLALFEPAGRGSHDPVLRALPQPARLRLSVITRWSPEGLVSSCFEQRTQIVQQIGLMRPDRLLLAQLQAYVKSQGKGLAELTAVDAMGIDPIQPRPNEAADGIVALDIQPGSACAAGNADSLTFSIDMKVLRASDATVLEEKRIGGGVKGLRSMKVENTAQRRPVYETWLKEQPAAIYWDTVQILMRPPR